MSLQERKARLRIHLREARDAVPDADLAAAAQAVADRLADCTRACATVMGFLAFGSEIPTMPMLERLAAEGHDLVVPHIAGGELVPVAYVPGEALSAAVWGIPEPADLRPVAPAAIDAVFAPGLGFDRHGFRIGYGGGFYDRLFTRLRPDVVRIGVGLHVQVIEDVPHGDHDQALQFILTERETIRAH